MSPVRRRRDRPASLRVEEWPEADRGLFEAAFAPGDVFDRGPLAHMKASSQSTTRWSYGAWLAYVAAEHPDRLAMPPADRADRATLAAFARRLAADGSTRNTINTHMRAIARLLTAGGDTGINARVRGLAALGATRRKIAAETVTSNVLIDLGLRLMRTALECAPADRRGWAEDYRDGLIVALLAAAPLRRANFAALRLGEGLLVNADRILVCVDPEFTKSKRGWEGVVPAELDSWVRLYLDEVRQRLKGAVGSDYLWPSARGPYLTADRVYNIVASRTQAEFGFPLSPHDFRDAAATTIALHAPKRIAIARDLLGHADLKTTHHHYIRSRGIATSREVGRIFDRIRKTRS